MEKLKIYKTREGWKKDWNQTKENFGILCCEKEKESIDKLVEELRGAYLDGSKINFQKLSEDYNINLFESKKIFNAWSTKQFGEYYALIPKYTMPSDKESAKAHEIGHILLGHFDNNWETTTRSRKEAEAVYFAEKLTGGILHLQLPLVIGTVISAGLFLIYVRFFEPRFILGHVIEEYEFKKKNIDKIKNVKKIN